MTPRTPKTRKDGAPAGRAKSPGAPKRPAKAPLPVVPVRPRLRVVQGGLPEASFPQRASASNRQLLMFELIRARASFLAAVHGMSPASANEPLASGRWSVRETVLHLVTRDLARLEEFEAMRAGVAPSWRDAPDPRMAEINARLLAPLAGLDWESALRRLHGTREELLDQVEGVPDLPADVWEPEHPFGWMLRQLPPHDRHHAGIVKRWRATRDA